MGDTAEAGAGSAAPASANKAPVRDLSSMTEEEQIAYAMQMSMADVENAEETPKTESMDVDEKDEDYSEVMNDPAFLQSVLQNLPGVDPQSEAVRNAVGAAKPRVLALRLTPASGPLLPSEAVASAK